MRRPHHNCDARYPYWNLNSLSVWNKITRTYFTSLHTRRIQKDELFASDVDSWCILWFGPPEYDLNLLWCRTHNALMSQSHIITSYLYTYIYNIIHVVCKCIYIYIYINSWWIASITLCWDCMIDYIFKIGICWINAKCQMFYSIPPVEIPSWCFECDTPWPATDELRGVEFAEV